MSTIHTNIIENLIQAAENDDLSTIDSILIDGADDNYMYPGKTCKTPLIYAIIYGNINIVDLLIKHGADINKPNKNGNTPLIMAIINERLKIVDLLIKHGADINKPNKHGHNPLHYAINNTTIGIKMFDLIVKNGADINHIDKHGNTVLHEAVKYNRPSIVERLFENGAIPHIKDKYGQTPLVYARNAYYYHIVNIIKKYIKTQFLYTCIGLRKQRFGDNILFEIGKHFLESEKEIIIIINQSNKFIEK